ncbi:helix-turn-helix domain-containing protein [Halocynthiibacter styelae]|uniref:Helix-turn-helix transcriptional regulator n=1 Tax=Halocynthiibacter styelae TaxID=2761955 RepID=A0A8J7IEJ2_9RHOB|nr:helix-turn-helix transcriptional regulator [Paenihalocynthiibacter styelae]MBI1494849.1 helix-turn-helix transcriptional regulator [Paenihalocynthiibacter styelae]
MSVSKVFSLNLRRLTDQVGNVSEVARLLDINRAQFNRYLSAESYPKPPILARICDYFGVDARILTDPLDEEALHALPEPGTERKPSSPSHFWENAAHWLPECDFDTPGQKHIEDGLYLYWRQSLANKAQYIATPAQIGTTRGLRTFRMYGVKSPIMMTHTLPPRQREIRGILLGQELGIAIFLPPSQTSLSSITIYLNNSYSNSSVFLSGHTTIARDPRGNYSNTARCLFQRLPADPRSVVFAARHHRYFKPEELPTDVAPLLLTKG